MDKLSSAFQHFSFNADVFFSGNLCSISEFKQSSNLCGHLHTVQSGVLTVIDSNKQQHKITKPSVLFFTKESHHRLIPEPGSNVELVCATINYKNESHNPITHSMPSFVNLPLDDPTSKLGQTATWLFEEAFSELNGGKLVMDRLCDILIIQLLRETLKNNTLAPGALNGLAHPQLFKALTAIHNQPEKPWSVESLGTEASMSRAKFAELFHNLVGQTPLNYLTDWRINLAKSLLKKGLTVSEVSQRVGYENSSSFTRVFSKKEGTSPKKWAQ
ncbi:AraC family transcriptional regulator [Alteromonas sp. 5E99-2]|uniref:cupin domain-containing protein n=1 Tax=Alteromonas sp. 5E99-2 TaxID=2817683 RepID=UPI001A99D446|nr:AraC family transcriptional regulator [Alteromonas sp. 5E99-2]